MCVNHSIVIVFQTVPNIFNGSSWEWPKHTKKRVHMYCMTKWDADKKPRKFVDIIKTKRIQIQTVSGSNVQQHTLSSLRWPEESWQLKVCLFVKTEFGVGMRIKKKTKIKRGSRMGIWDPPVKWPHKKWMKKTYRTR